MVTWMWLIFWIIHIVGIPILGLMQIYTGKARLKAISAYLIFCLLVYWLLSLNV